MKNTLHHSADYFLKTYSSRRLFKKKVISFVNIFKNSDRTSNNNNYLFHRKIAL